MGAKVHKKDDFVMYSQNGIYKIEDIRTEHIRGMKDREYYILQSVYDENARVMIPLDNEKLVAKMRDILSVDEINSIIEKTEDIDRQWIDNSRERADEFNRIIDEGNGADVLWIVKILSLHKIKVEKERKKFLSTDERILNSAEKIIAENFAFVLGINKRDVIDYIVNHIGGSKKECIS